MPPNGAYMGPIARGRVLTCYIMAPATPQESVFMTSILEMETVNRKVLSKS